MQRLRVARMALLILALALPAPLWSQAAATTVTCKDGTTSKAAKGACSHHGGVARQTAAAPEKTQARPATTVTCNDGTTSKPDKGACSHHGGVGAAPANPPAAIPANPALPVTAKAKTPAGHRTGGRDCAVQRRVVFPCATPPRRLLQAWRRQPVAQERAEVAR
jgi:hypothetical protein